MRIRSLVLTGVAALALTGLAAPGPASSQESRGAACEVRLMRTPVGADDGTVMDIEQVPGLGTVYYGSYLIRDGSGRKVRRAVVWNGLDARPRRVGPRRPGFHIAFELTPSGLVNGQSTLRRSGRERAWVYDLRTDDLTWADTTVPGRRTKGFYFRRINDRGNAAGTIDLANGHSRPAAWRRPDRSPRLLPAGPQQFGEGWAVNNRREVVGAYARPLPEELGFPEGAAYPQGAIWRPDGSRVRLAGLGYDTYPRMLNDAGQASGVVWYGPYDSGHGETGSWSSPGEVTALGLLPGGGFSGAYGMSEGGWVVGTADRFDPENPFANDMGAVDHSFLWTGEEDAVRVLPSPVAVETGEEDWRQWYGGAAHAVHTGLDQVGSSGHAGEHPSGRIRYLPTVWVHARACGQLVPTTHTAFWEEDGGQRSARVPARPEGYGPEAVRRTVSSRIR